MKDVEPLLLTASLVRTFEGEHLLTTATGFFFERGERLFLVTSRHVMADKPSKHFPDRLEILLHVDPQDMARTASYSIPLYRERKSVWRQGRDSAGGVDVAAIELHRDALPGSMVYRAFGPDHLHQAGDRVEVGDTVLVVGFPLGFHDALHHLPVVRHAVIASSFGLRFQGQGFFLTDGRTHRGSSGAAVVMRRRNSDDPLPWTLLGVHSARLDMGTRDVGIDEALGLNCSWYADMLITLTED